MSFACDRVVSGVGMRLQKKGVQPSTAFDAGLIAAIADAVVRVIQALANCGKSPVQAASILKDPGPLQRHRFNNIFRRSANEYFTSDTQWGVYDKAREAFYEEAAATPQSRIAQCYMEVAASGGDHAL